MESDTSSSSNDVPQASSAKKKRYSQKYKASWEQLPECKGWLKSSTKGTYYAFCAACHVHLSLQAGIRDIKSHAKGKKHAKNCSTVMQQPSVLNMPSVSGRKKLDDAVKEKMARQIPTMLRDFWGDHRGRQDVWGDREFGFDRPSKIFDQFFGSGLPSEDVLVPSSSLYTRCRRPPKERSGVSQVTQEANEKFVICLDVQQFTPDELKVRVVEGVIEVEAKHEMRQDEHGSISRHFVRKYTLPDDVLTESVSSALSPEGVLIIEAPKRPIEPPPPTQRDVPIQKASEKKV